jgi:hypothetical protein
MESSLIAASSSGVIPNRAASCCGLKGVGLGCGSARVLRWWVLVVLVKAGGGCASSFRSSFRKNSRCSCKIGTISAGVRPNWAAAESGWMWILGGNCGSQ